MYPTLHPPPYPSAPVDSDEETEVQTHEEGFEVVEKEAKKPIYPEVSRFEQEPEVVISEDELRKMNFKSYKGKEIFKKEMVSKMKFENIETSICYGYFLETFAEERYIKEVQEPTNSSTQRISAEPPPYEPFNIWSVPIFPRSDFIEETEKQEIPGSSEIKSCQTCNTIGLVQCWVCSGTGRKRCMGCWGSGKVKREDEEEYIPCSSCRSNGYIVCYSCNGMGRKNCKECKGNGHLRHFRQLIVKFVVEKSQFFTNNQIPEKKLEYAISKELFSEKREFVINPIENFHVEEINVTSRVFVSQHVQKHQDNNKRI
uniref:Protein SSUH2 homolog n=1 Tax=Acrobeloides nanus TaxID=290746 RepID=A0A914ECH1_9BILA